MTTELKATDSLPDIEELMKLQQNTKTMTVFCDHFLSCIVGEVEWKHQVTHKQVKEFANIMDEAFALLVLENIWDDWINVNTTDYLLPNKRTRRKMLKVTSTQKQVEDAGLQILRELFGLVVGIQMVYRDSMNYVQLLSQIVKTMVNLILIICQ